MLHMVADGIDAAANVQASKYEVQIDGNGVGADTFLWKKDGVKIWTVDLNVGHGRRWRTWARKAIRRVNVGSWTVEVQDRAGNLLETVAYSRKNMTI